MKGKRKWNSQQFDRKTQLRESKRSLERTVKAYQRAKKLPSDVQKAQSTEKIDRNQMTQRTSARGSSACVPNTQQQFDASSQQKSQQSHHKSSANGPLNNHQTAMIVQAYVTGYLKAIHPTMYANTVVLSRRVVVYLKEENIVVEQGEIIEFMVTYMGKQLAFTESKVFVSLFGSC